MMLSSKENRKEHIWLILLFLAFSNWMTYGGYILSFTLLIYFILHIQSFYINFAILPLILFSLFYTLFYGYHFGFDISYVINSLFMPWAAYFMGEDLFKRMDHGKALPTIMWTVAAGFFFHGLLNLGYTMFSSGSNLLSVRLAYDFWKQSPVAVTTNGAYFTMAVGLAFGYLNKKNKLWQNILAAVFILIGAYDSFLLGYRTGIVIIGALILVIVISSLRSDRNDTNLAVKRIVILAALITILVLLWKLDVAGIRSGIESSLLYQRITNPSEAHSDSRLSIWKSFFREWLSYPLGGAAFSLYRNQSFVHNMLLDFYYTTGILPFLTMLVFLVTCIAKMISYVRYSKLLGGNNHRAVFCLYIAVILNSMVEPLWNANPYFLIGFFLITGAVSAAVKDCKQQLTQRIKE